MNFYISDPHFGHENIIRRCHRPFSDADEMDDRMTTLWNETVTDADTVYLIGDLSFKAKHDPEWYLSRLNGRKILIIGNHDRSWCTGAAAQRCFCGIHNLLYITDGGEQITLCHFPLMSWPHELRSYMIFGHIHNRTDVAFWPLIRQNPRMLNAGADVNGFKPVTLAELIENNEAFKRNN